jgi:molybdenum cofactor synthesis domain-containing protein
MPTPTAAILIIGNEVLSAKVRDENGYYAACRLRELGVQLVGTQTVPDVVEEIAQAVERLRGRVSWLFTSGGVGPTHDDVTLAGIARAFGRTVERSAEMEGWIRTAHQRATGSAEVPEAALRMADLPRGTRLFDAGRFPVMLLENVVILPGVPIFFQRQFDAFAQSLAAPPFRLACIYLGVGEERIAEVLDQVAASHPEVAIGSYPRFDEADHRVRLTIEAKDVARVEQVLAELLRRLPSGAVLRTEGP